MTEYTPTTFIVGMIYTDYSSPAHERRAEFTRWLTAHDAEIRAEQIKKDVAIAETTLSEYWVSHSVAAALRAQLTEGETDE